MMRSTLPHGDFSSRIDGPGGDKADRSEHALVVRRDEPGVWLFRMVGVPGPGKKQPHAKQRFNLRLPCGGVAVGAVGTVGTVGTVGAVGTRWATVGTVGTGAGDCTHHHVANFTRAGSPSLSMAVPTRTPLSR